MKPLHIILVLLTVVAISNVAFAVHPFDKMPEAQPIINGYFALLNNNDFTCLVSYPKSGNSFLRYLIEYLTKRPTVDFHSKCPDRLNCPLGMTFDCLSTRLELAPVWKVHSAAVVTQQSFYDPHRVKMILLVRNYKENALKISKSHGTPLFVGDRLHEVNTHKILDEYFQNVAIFDALEDQNKIIIYYEDLLNSPEETLKKLVAFLDVSDEYLVPLLDNYEQHKNNMLALYPQPESKGEDLFYHSKKAGVHKCSLLDGWVRKHHPYLLQNYLLRYQS